MTTQPSAPSPAVGAFARSGPVSPSLADITTALRVRYPDRSDAAVHKAALRVHFELESNGPVTITGPGSAADALIDRTLIAMDARNAARRGGVHSFAAPITTLARDLFARRGPPIE